MPAVTEKPSNKVFLEQLRGLRNLDCSSEVDALGEVHGHGTLAHLQALIDNKILSKEEACRQWSDSIGIAYVDVLASAVTFEAVEKLPQEIATKTQSIGLYIIDGVLTVAMATPQDSAMIRRLEHISQTPVSPVFCLPCEIMDAIAIHYSTEKTLADSLAELERDSSLQQQNLSGDGLAALADSECVVRALDEIIYFALRERATDIHIEPQDIQSRIRFRVDGNMREVLNYSRKLHRALITRMKILCNLNIAESRFPQDGRFSITVGTNKADFRFSCIPTVHGEKIVIRVLASSGKRTMMTLDRMMISQRVLNPFRRLIQNPNGIIFVTGPTGCGKTTTLYAALHAINQPGVNISTIEDPVEIQLPGITQTQVNNHIDLKFSTLLRSLLRQDPDVILVGEIRDLETAKIATEAALTGHLVFATLHTNSAPQALVRLAEIGVEHYMIAPSILGVLSQRLAARICEKCKETYFPGPEVLRRYFHDETLPEIPFYRGRGCPQCRGTGFHGRVAFHELMLVTDNLRAMIAERAPIRDITAEATKTGYRPLRYDGLKKVLLGLTTIEEIEQSTTFEWAS